MSHADTCRFLLSIPSTVTDFRTFSRSLTASDSPKLFGLVLVSVPNLMREGLPSARTFRARDVNNSEAEFEFNAFVSRSTRAGDPILVNAKASIRSPGKFHLDEAELVHPLWVGKIRCEYEVPGMSSSAIGTSIRKLIRERPSDCGNYIRERVALLGDAQQYDAEIRRRFGDYPAFLRALHCPEDLDLHLSAKEIGTLLALSKPEPLLPIAIPLRAVAMGALNSGISLTETQSQIILKMVNELSERQPLLFAGCASSIPIWEILLLLGAAAQGGYKCALLVPDQRHALRRKQFLAKAFPRIEIAAGTFSASATDDGGVNIINQSSDMALHHEGQTPLDLIVFEDNGRYIPSPPLFLSTPRKTRWLIVANIPLETQQANDRYGIVPRVLTIEPSPAPKFTEAHVNDPEALLNKVLSLTDEGRHIVIYQWHADEASSAKLEQLASVWRTLLAARYGRDAVGALLAKMSDAEKDGYIKRVETGAVLLTVSDCIQYEPDAIRIDAIVLPNINDVPLAQQLHLKSRINVDDGFFITSN